MPTSATLSRNDRQLVFHELSRPTRYLGVSLATVRRWTGRRAHQLLQDAGRPAALLARPARRVHRARCDAHARAQRREQAARATRFRRLGVA